MKRVVSVSLGSSTRNHSAEVEFLGEKVHIERIGTDGNMLRAVQLIKELDGKVDAIGLGGTDLYIVAGDRRYVLRDTKQMAQAAKVTPVVDGSGLKGTLEPRAVHWLQDSGVLDFRGRTVLLVVAVDRFGMARAFDEIGARLILGDLIFTMGFPLPLRSLRSLDYMARVLAPILSQLPISMLYPTGKKQEENTPKFGRYFEQADVIAGDFHFIHRYMPQDLSGKIVITNTVTSRNVEEFRERGVQLLVTTTPEIEGRSFATNVMEGLLVALSGRSGEELTPEDYEEILDRLNIVPRLVHLQEGAGSEND